MPTATSRRAVPRPQPELVARPAAGDLVHQPRWNTEIREAAEGFGLTHEPAVGEGGPGSREGQQAEIDVEVEQPRGSPGHRLSPVIAQVSAHRVGQCLLVDRREDGPRLRTGDGERRPGELGSGDSGQRPAGQSSSLPSQMSLGQFGHPV
jgi:hypothetical protein